VAAGRVSGATHAPMWEQGYWSRCWSEERREMREGSGGQGRLRVGWKLGGGSRKLQGCF
jgi:hypothetical protein